MVTVHLPEDPGDSCYVFVEGATDTQAAVRLINLVMTAVQKTICGTDPVSNDDLMDAEVSFSGYDA